MKNNDRKLELLDAVDGFPFSLRTEGKASRTIEYYEDLLKYFLRYAENNKRPKRVQSLDASHLRQFLAWVGNRTFEHKAGNGTHLMRKAKPSTVWPYYKALRRLFNWLTEERLTQSNPLSNIRFKAPIIPQTQFSGNESALHSRFKVGRSYCPS